MRTYELEDTLEQGEDDVPLPFFADSIDSLIHFGDRMFVTRDDANLYYIFFIPSRRDVSPI